VTTPRAEDIPNNYAEGEDIYDRSGERYTIEKREPNSNQALLRGATGFYGWQNIESALLLDGEPVPHWTKYKPLI